MPFAVSLPPRGGRADRSLNLYQSGGACRGCGTRGGCSSCDSGYRGGGRRSCRRGGTCKAGRGGGAGGARSGWPSCGGGGSSCAGRGRCAWEGGSAGRAGLSRRARCSRRARYTGSSGDPCWRTFRPRVVSLGALERPGGSEFALSLSPFLADGGGRARPVLADCSRRPELACSCGN